MPERKIRVKIKVQSQRPYADQKKKDSKRSETFSFAQAAAQSKVIESDLISVFLFEFLIRGPFRFLIGVQVG